MNFTDSFDSGSGKGGDKDLQDFLMLEKQKAQFNAQIHEFNEFCWDKCVEKPGNKLDSKTETCLSNCVDRFIDVSVLITNRFAQLLQKSGGKPSTLKEDFLPDTFFAYGLWNKNRKCLGFNEKNYKKTVSWKSRTFRVQCSLLETI